MNNWKVIFATAVIFGAGVITGGLLVNYVQHGTHVPIHRKAGGQARANANANARAAENNRAHLPTSLSRQFMQKLDEALKLKPKQRENIRKIIADGQGQICRVIQDSRLEIRKELSPVQRKKFDQLIKRQLHRTITETNAPKKTSAGSMNAETNLPSL